MKPLRFKILLRRITKHLQEAGPMGDKMAAMFRSRRFWGAIATMLVIVSGALFDDFFLTPEQITNIVYVVAALIVGDSLTKMK